MKQYLRFQSLVIPGKLRIDIRLMVDSKYPEFISSKDDTRSVTLSLFPTVSIQLTKAIERNDEGKVIPAPWNPNDTLSMTKYNFPIFLEELIGMKNDMKTPDLYVYTGKRLELNEDAAAKIRRVFMIGNMTIELSSVVIVQPDDTRVEGIKMKFNNEQSTVFLTLNEISSLAFNLSHMDIDSIALSMYLNYTTKPSKPTSFDSSSLPKVDIIPKEVF